MHTPHCRRVQYSTNPASRPSAVHRAFTESRSRGATTISAKQIVSFTHLPPRWKTPPATYVQVQSTYPQMVRMFAADLGEWIRQTAGFRAFEWAHDPPCHRLPGNAMIRECDDAFFTAPGKASASYRYIAETVSSANSTGGSGRSCTTSRAEHKLQALPYQSAVLLATTLATDEA